MPIAFGSQWTSPAEIEAAALARRAAWSGDTQRLRSLAVAYPSIVAVGTGSPRDGSTLAHLACLSGHTAVLELLAQLGCCRHGCFDAKDTRGQTPLHWAAIHNQEQCVVALQAAEGSPLEHRAAQWQRRDKRGRTPAHWAAHLGHAKILNQLRMHYASHGEMGQRALLGVLSATDCSGRNVMQLWDRRRQTPPTEPMNSAAIMHCPAVFRRALALSQNRHLIAEVDDLLDDATATATVEERSISVVTMRAPEPIPYRWTEAGQREEAAALQLDDVAARVQRQLDRHVRHEARTVRLEETERAEAAALIAGDEEALHAAHAAYLEMDAEALADEEDALAKGDVPHTIEAKLELDISLPSTADSLAALKTDFVRELAYSLGVTEAQLVDVQFQQSGSAVHQCDGTE
jgi:hypothetical protein